MSEKPVKYNAKLSKIKKLPSNLELLQTRYKRAVKDYIEFFEEKEEMEFEGWVADQWGGVALVSDYTIDFLDIKYSIDHELDAGFILQWMNDSVEDAMGREVGDSRNINLSSYHKGLRYTDLKK